MCTLGAFVGQGFLLRRLLCQILFSAAQGLLLNKVLFHRCSISQGVLLDSYWVKVKAQRYKTGISLGMLQNIMLCGMSFPAHNVLVLSWLCYDTRSQPGLKAPGCENRHLCMMHDVCGHRTIGLRDTVNTIPDRDGCAASLLVALSH